VRQTSTPTPSSSPNSATSGSDESISAAKPKAVATQAVAIIGTPSVAAMRAASPGAKAPSVWW